MAVVLGVPWSPYGRYLPGRNVPLEVNLQSRLLKPQLQADEERAHTRVDVVLLLALWLVS
ncbi:hypothetical protein MEBOL_006982 [Melittangium boletus DSM 14713]|uniref:Uncharacterized protein n=1 Tax=Melittangium boletus DSM 14713 TaxID=1294270 RepID=A0A250IP25_9BACT|nr:hypothetical protein MEBOL_006982 [Melittangium boletus DSM 14713]